MLYAYTQHTPIFDSAIRLNNHISDLAFPILSETRAQRIGGRWLVVAKETGAWCLLEDQEYGAYQQIKNKFSFRAILQNKTNVNENRTFLHHLIRCGIIAENQVNESFICTPRPFSLTLISSDHCNLVCKYCYLSMSPNRHPLQLSPTIAQQNIRDAFQQASDSILIDFGEIAVNYSLAQDLILYTEYLHEQFPDKKLLLAVQTNGTTLTPKVLDFLEDHQIIVGVSLDGPKHIHDMMRVSLSGRGSHSRIESGLREIIRRGIEYIVVCTVSAANIGAAPEILDYFLDLGIAHFSFKPVIRRGNAEASWQSLGVSVQQFCDFLEDVVDYAISNHNWDALDDRLVKFAFRFLRDHRGWSDHCPTAECGCGTDMLVLNPQGVLYPCPRFASTIKKDSHLGYKLSEATTVASQLHQKLFEDFLPHQCRQCIWWPFCKGGCPLTRHASEIKKPSVDPSCKIYRFSYELIVNRILPELSNNNHYRGGKLGKIQIMNLPIFPTKDHS